MNSSIRYISLSLLTIAYIFNFIDRQILAILLPYIKVEFNAEDWLLGFLAGPAFAILYVTLGIPLAILADRWSRRNLVMISTACWSLMTCLCGIVTSLFQLVLTRIGVGIGEAGFSPAAHSLIADMFPSERRSLAMGVFTLGIAFGIMFAYIGGAWIVSNFGWRETFLFVGFPGLMIALAIWKWVPEPPRDSSGKYPFFQKKIRFLKVVKFLLIKKSFVHMSLGAGFASFSAYAVLSFFPSFLQRSHGLNIKEIGLYLGLVIGLSTAIGFVGGGYLADRLAVFGRRYSLWVIAFAMLLGWLFIFPMYLIEDPYLILLILFVPSVLNNMYLPTIFAQTQSLVPVSIRSLSASILLFVINVLGLGFGPLFTGVLSDSLYLIFGSDSLRYSLMIICGLIGPLTVYHFICAGKYIESDLKEIDTL